MNHYMEKHAEQMMRNMMYNFHSLEGPYLCTQKGKYVTVEDVANPEYTPYVRFHVRPEHYDTQSSYVYRMDTDELWTYDDSHIMSDPESWCDPILTKIEERSTYYKVLLEQIRTNDIQVWKYTKCSLLDFHMVAPKLISQQIVSVQPMTQPVSSVFYLNHKYGQNRGTIDDSK